MVLRMQSTVCCCLHSMIYLCHLPIVLSLCNWFFNLILHLFFLTTVYCVYHTFCALYVLHVLTVIIVLTVLTVLTVRAPQVHFGCSGLLSDRNEGHGPAVQRSENDGKSFILMWLFHVCVVDKLVLCIPFEGYINSHFDKKRITELFSFTTFIASHCHTLRPFNLLFLHFCLSHPLPPSPSPPSHLPSPSLSLTHSLSSVVLVISTGRWPLRLWVKHP